MLSHLQENQIVLKRKFKVDNQIVLKRKFEVDNIKTHLLQWW